MHDKFRVRRATPSDWLGVFSLFEQLYHGDVGPDLRNVFTTLTTSKENCIFVAEQDRNLVGAIVGSFHLDMDWEGKIAKLQAIIIDEKRRDKGIGRHLFRYFLTQARKNNCRAITARVNRKNKKACVFYEALNFEEAETNEYILEL